MSVENNDHNLDVFRKEFGGEAFPLTDREKEIRRRAGIFAVATFIEPTSEDLSLAFEFKEELRREKFDTFLTPVQMQLASEMALENSQIGDRLFVEDTKQHPLFGNLMRTPRVGPGVESGYRSFASLWVNHVGDFLIDSTKEEPILTPAQQAAFAGRRIISIKSHLEEDPSGLSYLQAVIGTSEEKALQKVIETLNNVGEVEARYTIIDNFTEDEDLLPQLGTIDTSIFTDEEKELFKSAMDELILPSLRDSYKWRAKYLILEDTGLVPDEDGKAVPYSVLRVRGMRLGLERYTVAVERFLEKWGNS